MNKQLKLIIFLFFTLGPLHPLYALTSQSDHGSDGEVPTDHFVPPPLTPWLSDDGKTLYDALQPLVVVADPNPSHGVIHIPAPKRLVGPAVSASATFNISYLPAGSTDAYGEPCYTFPEEAKVAFNAAAGIWGNIIRSSVPITIKACWAQLDSSSILGYSGGGSQIRDFPNAPRLNTFYTSSLANALAGQNLVPGYVDMNITYNSLFPWYYGIDGNTPAGEYDLVSVVLHEIAHGLNFAGMMEYSGGYGRWGWGYGYPNIYDTFITDGSGNQLISTSVYGNPSTALGSALTSNNIWFTGSNAMAANSGGAVKIFAPSTWMPGSSYAHLDYNTFSQTANRLMVYALQPGSSFHDPGPVTLGLFKDLGWPSGGTSALSGTATGMKISKVVCSNLSTGLVISATVTNNNWGCPASGWNVSPGDLITMTVKGVAN